MTSTARNACALRHTMGGEVLVIHPSHIFAQRHVPPPELPAMLTSVCSGTVLLSTPRVQLAHGSVGYDALPALIQQHGTPKAQCPAATGSYSVHTQCVQSPFAQQLSSQACALSKGTPARLAVSVGQCNPGWKVLPAQAGPLSPADNGCTVRAVCTNFGGPGTSPARSSQANATKGLMIWPVDNIGGGTGCGAVLCLVLPATASLFPGMPDAWQQPRHLHSPVDSERGGAASLAPCARLSINNCRSRARVGRDRMSHQVNLQQCFRPVSLRAAVVGASKVPVCEAMACWCSRSNPQCRGQVATIAIDNKPAGKQRKNTAHCRHSLLQAPA